MARERLQKRRATLRCRRILEDVRAEVQSMARARGRQLQPPNETRNPNEIQKQTVTGMEMEPKPNMTQLQPSIDTRRLQSANSHKRKSPANCSDTRSNETSPDVAEQMRRVRRLAQDEDKKHTLEQSEKPCATPAATWLRYQCPYCQANVESTIKNGTVKVAGHCGKQFRVSNGLVARRHMHACTQCGTKVHSACVSGQLKCSHHKPNGKLCPTTRWYVK